MAAKKLRRAQLSQEMCERLSRYQITTCQVKELFCLWEGQYFVGRFGLVVLVFCWWIGVGFLSVGLFCGLLACCLVKIEL